MEAVAPPLSQIQTSQLLSHSLFLWQVRSEALLDGLLEEDSGG